MRQAHIRLINAVLRDGLVIGHARKGRGDLLPGSLKGGLEEALGHAEDRLLRGEADLQVDLRELRLAVGAEVLVAEAACDLEVAVEAADHQNLLEDLRRLRQRVEVAGMYAAGDEVIARALRRGARHERRLDLQEALAGELRADGLRDPVPRHEIGLHLRAAQVDIAVLQPQFLIADGVFRGRERRRLCVGEQEQFMADDFDVAGGHVGVPQALAANTNRADGGNDELRARCFGLGQRVRAGLRAVHHHLRNAAAIAHVQKDKVAVVAAAVDPAHQGNGLAGIGGAEVSAHVRALVLS